MPVLYAIAAIAGLALVVFLNVVKQKATTELYRKLHPPKKQQEEFLHACRLYLEYRKQPEAHPEPAKDAKRDAAMEIQTQGFLPACLEHLGYPKKQDARLKLFAADGEPEHITYRAIETASPEAFLACQAQDRSLSGYSQDPRFWNDATFNLEAWERYCSEMKQEFQNIRERFSEDA